MDLGKSIVFLPHICGLIFRVNNNYGGTEIDYRHITEGSLETVG